MDITPVADEPLHPSREITAEIVVTADHGRGMRDRVTEVAGVQVRNDHPPSEDRPVEELRQFALEVGLDLSKIPLRLVERILLEVETRMSLHLEDEDALIEDEEEVGLPRLLTPIDPMAVSKLAVAHRHGIRPRVPRTQCFMQALLRLPTGATTPILGIITREERRLNGRGFHLHVVVSLRADLGSPPATFSNRPGAGPARNFARSEPTTESAIKGSPPARLIRRERVAEMAWGRKYDEESRLPPETLRRHFARFNPTNPSR